MRITLIRGLALALFLSGSALAQEQAAPAQADMTLLPYASTEDAVRLEDGRVINLVCTGSGSPTVILTAGAGNWSTTWHKVQPAIAERTRVCTWDRAGYGLSGPSPHVQTIDNTTSDLEAAIAAGEIAGPYVVVGHSLGGLESLLFKDRQPSEVVGMVLVDPSIPGQLEALERVSPDTLRLLRIQQQQYTDGLEACAEAIVRNPRACGRPPIPADYPEQLREAVAAPRAPEMDAAYMRTVASFVDSVDEGSQIAVKPDRDYGDMPLIVLTAGRSNIPPQTPQHFKDEASAQAAEMRLGRQALASLSTRGELIMVEDSGHSIQLMRPDVVIDAIKRVHAAAGDGTKPS